MLRMKKQVNLLLNCYRPQIDISWFQTMIFARPAHNVIECKRVRFMADVEEGPRACACASYAPAGANLQPRYSSTLALRAFGVKAELGSEPETQQQN